METASSFSPAPISPTPPVPVGGASSTAPATPAVSESPDVVIQLSPEAVAVLQGMIEPGEAVAAVREGDATDPLKGIAADAQDPSNEDGVFQLYGLVDVDGDGETDGPAGAAQPEEADGAQAAAEEERGAEADEDAEGLSEEERQVVAEMAARDAEVRAHEMAHMAAGGGLTGGVSFSYQTGPDGKRYAVGGSVSIDTSPGNTPEETINGAQRIRAAALAPAEPSGQDRSVAAQASQMEASARAELAEENMQESRQALAEASEGSAERAQPTEASAAAFGQSIEAEGAEETPAFQPPPRADIRGDEDNRSLQSVDAPATLNRATLAQFESGDAAQAQAYGLPAPDNALVAGPIDDSAVAFSLVR